VGADAGYFLSEAPIKDLQFQIPIKFPGVHAWWYHGRKQSSAESLNRAPMILSNCAGGVDFLSGVNPIFFRSQKDGKTKPAGRFTVSINKCQILLTEIRHSGQR
jgi:hypothetical protein